ncbi:glycoside hydrolase superfamily [Lineolata rhizophorae]|uniref:Glycoside hydrolase superfamily n=1 Tax=Lineolata rhizophorae TaxID=578093 RepID=A0A6A6P6M4_9PEZI|nr:glycoside hydrolase superfamily [Lineolata rhizophorae]
MKAATIFALAAFAAGLATGQPHGRRHGRVHPKRELVTLIQYVTVTAADVIVFVDEYGVPFSTGYGDRDPATQAPLAPSSVEEVKPAPVEPTTVPEAPLEEPGPVDSPSSVPAEAPPTMTPTSAPTLPAEPVVSSPPSVSTAIPRAPAATGGIGITYSPYNADASCKNADEVYADFQQLGEYGVVRIYGTDCNQVETAFAAAQALGHTLFLGVWNLDILQQELDHIIDTASSDWSVIDTISIGNELVNNGLKSPGEVVGTVNNARGILRAAGYQGPVVTVDTHVAIIAHPELCEASDYVAANCHAFFDGGVVASEAGNFVLSQAQRVSSTCGGRRTVITETGWPSAGTSNHLAIPSPNNQRAAIASLKNIFSGDLILFTAFNDLWKTNNAATHEAEEYWGIVN